MIKSHVDGGGLIIEGSVAEVSAECILVMREIYKRNKKEYGDKIATGILTNMLIKAIDDSVTKEDIASWEISEKEKLAYTE